MVRARRLLRQRLSSRRYYANRTFSRERNSRMHMLARCYNPNHVKYKWYGERGIRVCDRWRKSFQNFIDDMGQSPIGTCIGRIDNDGNYEPSNCRWETQKEQQRNRSNLIYVEIDGETMCLISWCEKWGLNYDKLRKKVSNGRDAKKLLLEEIL